MTDQLLQQFEEKLVLLLKEVENLRSELNLVKMENSSLRLEKTNSLKKLQSLVSLLDAPERMRSSMLTSEHEVLPG